MNFRPFEQYQLSCIEERPSGAALIFYLSNFNIAWIFITETNAEISNQDASLWDVFLICLPAAGIVGKGWFLKPHSFWVRFF